MRSLLITTELFHIGGLETHVAGEVACLTEEGFRIHLVAGANTSDRMLPKEAASVTAGMAMGPATTTAELIQTVESLRKIIREQAVECVHAHPFMSLVPSQIAAELEGVPFVVTLHGPASLSDCYGPLYDFLITSVILPNADMVVAVSQEVADLAGPYVDDARLCVLPNGVPVGEFGTGQADDYADGRWLLVSRLDAHKIIGVREFIQKSAAAGLPGVLLAGDGDARENLQLQLGGDGLSNYVEFFGATTEVPRLMRRAAGVAGMGRVVLEGLACGKPVVLVGYDGVKGLLTPDAFRIAAATNFSGRRMPSINAAEFSRQLSLTQRGINDLTDQVRAEYSDKAIWHKFAQNLGGLKTHGRSLLSDAYIRLASEMNAPAEAYLYSQSWFEQMARLVRSPKYFDQSVVANFNYAKKRYVDNNSAIQLANLNQAVAERDGQLANLNQAVAERDGQLASLNQAVAERDGQIASLNQMVAEHDGQIASLNQMVAERDRQIASLNQMVAERDGQIASLNQMAAEHDGQIASLNQMVAERGGQIASLNQMAAEHDGQIASLNQMVAERDGQIASLNQMAAEREELLSAARLYKEDKEIYIAMLKNELETTNSRIGQKIFRLLSRLKRLPHYVNRSLAVLRSRGFAGLLHAVAFKLMHRAAAVNNNYAQPPLAAAFAPIDATSNHLSIFSAQPLLGSTLVIVTGVPFDDVGGGQRAAQIARCALKTGRSVIYLYIYKKFDFELNEYVESDVVLHGLIHKFIETTSPAEVLSLVSQDATLLIELPHKEALPYLQSFNVRGMRTVFELIDDWESSLGGDWFDSDVYRRFVSEARVVVGSAKILVQKLRDLGRDDAVYLPNAANEYIFDKYKIYSRPADLPTNVNRIALYFGSLYGEWFAWDYLQEAAAMNADIAFVLIGDKPNSELLPVLPPNVYFLGAKRIDELPAYLVHSDLSLLPFLPGKISDAVSPIKVFEYLFSGRPVVATKLPEIMGYPGVLVANSPKEFSVLCKEADFTEESNKENDRFIFNNSWFSRLEILVAQSENTQFKNSVSVIVLIHNNKFIIGRCLESLLLHSAPYIKEVIVVDNASVDGGAEFVETNFPSVRVVRNAVNGCSSGRNIGVQMASGRFLAFFDSDQWFTSSSCFEEALTILSRDANVGAIGWAGGWFEAGRYDLGGMIADYCPNRAMNDAAIQRGYRADIGYLGTGGFFVPRSVFDATGGFDVTYDPTCFEDTDMSFQIKKLGLDVCYRDLTGIRHQPHQTTKASSGSGTYAKLFKRNANYFKRKWLAHPNFFVDYNH